MTELDGMQGNEIADDFIKKSSGKGAWSHGWDVFKSNFWKLIVLNMLTVITFVPGIAIVLIRNWYISGLGAIYPFNTSVSNFPPEQTVALPETLVLSADLLFYALLVVAGFVAAVGVSGSAYCIRRLINSNGEFRMKSFFHGVRVGYFNTLLPTVLFLVFMYSTILIGDWMHIEIAKGGNVPGAITAYVFIIIATVLAGLYLAWLFAVGISYRVKVKYLFKNSFALLLGTPIQTIFMAAFTLIPVWLLMMGAFWSMIAYVILIFFGISFMLLSWLTFTQWAFDLFIAPAVQHEKEAARAAKTPEQLAAEKAEEDRARALELLAAGKSYLISRPIKPIDRQNVVEGLGATFTRAQIAHMAEVRAELSGEVEEYRKQHEKDAVYVEYNKMFEEREKALSQPDKKKKSKKISADNLMR